MENAMLIAMVMGPMYLMLGLSIIFYKKQWVKVIEGWKKNHFSMMGLMFMHGILGLIVVNMYNVWDQTVWVLVTITGWGMLLKAVLYFLAPGDMWKNMMDVKKKPGMLAFGGVAATVIGVALSYYTYFA